MRWIHSLFQTMTASSTKVLASKNPWAMTAAQSDRCPIITRAKMNPTTPVRTTPPSLPPMPPPDASHEQQSAYDEEIDALNARYSEELNVARLRQYNFQSQVRT